MCGSSFGPLTWHSALRNQRRHGPDTQGLSSVFAYWRFVSRAPRDSWPIPVDERVFRDSLRRRYVFWLVLHQYASPRLSFAPLRKSLGCCQPVFLEKDDQAECRGDCRNGVGHANHQVWHHSEVPKRRGGQVFRHHHCRRGLLGHIRLDLDVLSRSNKSSIHICEPSPKNAAQSVCEDDLVSCLHNRPNPVGRQQ
ncbi:hypothetical protein LCGC14_2083100 [marine sediment metagenome]|uniref:Uncharacterized protein n=1 Tax=marine sediment metagenome TaxID=412755 RepID=A0A0F9EF85_9ZZZZ